MRVKGVESIIFCGNNHSSIDHEWLSIDCPIEWLLPEARETGRIRHTWDKPGTCVISVVHAPIGTGQLTRCHGAGGKRQWRDMHRLRRWDTQGPDEQTNLVTLVVE